MSNTKYYGLIDQKHAVQMAKRVCDVLGYGRYGVADLLILETACAETLLGEFRDPTLNGAGNGLCQHDKIPFYDVATRTRQKDKDLLIKYFGVDVDNTKWEELKHSPLLSLIWCRLHYKLIPAEIPDIQSKRAAYYKKYYNTVAGKGSTASYLNGVKVVGLYKYLPLVSE